MPNESISRDMQAFYSAAVPIGNNTSPSRTSSTPKQPGSQSPSVLNSMGGAWQVQGVCHLRKEADAVGNPVGFYEIGFPTLGL